MYPSYAAARSTLHKRQAALSQEHEHVRKMVLAQASAALRQALGIAARSDTASNAVGPAQGPPGPQLGAGALELLGLDQAATTEDGLPFVDPVEQLPDDESELKPEPASGSTASSLPRSAWSHLQGGAATIAPFTPAAPSAEARRRWIEHIFAQAGPDEEEGDDDEDDGEASRREEPGEEGEQQPGTSPSLQVAQPTQPTSTFTAPSMTDPATTPPLPEPSRPPTPLSHPATSVDVIPTSPELRPLPHSADLSPPTKPALKRTLSYVPVSPAGSLPSTPPLDSNTTTGPGDPLHHHPAPLPAGTELTPHDGVSWQPPPKAFGASGFKRGFLNLNPDSEGAKHSSDAVAGPSVWAREVETVPNPHNSTATEGDETEDGSSQPPPSDTGTEGGSDARGRSPTRAAGGTKHVRIISPSPSQRWHSHVWEQEPHSCLGRPLRNLTVSPGTDDPHAAEKMQVVLANPRPSEGAKTDTPSSPVSGQGLNRMTKDDVEQEDVADEAAKIIAVLGADAIAQQAGGVIVPHQAHVSDGAGGQALPRRPVAEPSSNNSLSADPSRSSASHTSRPALGRDVVERTPPPKKRSLPPKRQARRSSLPGVTTSAPAAQARRDSATPPAPPTLTTPPAGLDSTGGQEGQEPLPARPFVAHNAPTPSQDQTSKQDKPRKNAPPPISIKRPRVHPSPTPYPTPPVTGNSSPVPVMEEGSSTSLGNIPDGSETQAAPTSSAPNTTDASVTDSCSPSAPGKRQTKKRTLLGGFLKLNSSPVSAAPLPVPVPEPAQVGKQDPSTASASVSSTSDATIDSTLGSQNKVSEKLEATAANSEGKADTQLRERQIESPNWKTQGDPLPSPSSSDADEEASEEENQGLAERIRHVDPRTSVGVSALERAAAAEQIQHATPLPHARPTKAYAASLERRRRERSGMSAASPDHTSGPDDVDEDGDAHFERTGEHKGEKPPAPRRNSKVRFDLSEDGADGEAPAFGPRSPSSAREGGKVRFAPRASFSDGSESDTVRRVRFACPTSDTQAEPRNKEEDRAAASHPQPEKVDTQKLMNPGAVPSAERDVASDPTPSVVPGHGKIRFVTSEDEAALHSDQDGYDTDTPPPKVMERAQGTSRAQALRHAKERAVSATKAAALPSSHPSVEASIGEKKKTQEPASQEATKESLLRSGEVTFNQEDDAATTDDDDDNDDGTDQEKKEEEEDDDDMFSEEEYSPEDLAALRPRFEVEWNDEVGAKDGGEGSDEDEDDNDLDTTLHMAEIQREYARIKAGILADRHRWTAALGPEEHPLDPRTGLAIEGSRPDLVPSWASTSDSSVGGSAFGGGVSGSSGSGPGADRRSSGPASSTDPTSKPSKFKQERVARAFAAHAAQQAGASEESPHGAPLMVLPQLAPVRTFRGGRAVEQEDVLSAQGVDLDNSTDEEETRLGQIARERTGLGTESSSAPQLPPARGETGRFQELPSSSGERGVPASDLHSSKAGAPAAPQAKAEVGSVQERDAPSSGSIAVSRSGPSQAPPEADASAGTGPSAPNPEAGDHAQGAPPKRISRFKAARLAAQR